MNQLHPGVNADKLEKLRKEVVDLDQKLAKAKQTLEVISTEPKAISFFELPRQSFEVYYLNLMQPSHSSVLVDLKY
jgi:hypothetical protein